jgi:hypothetical protein
MRAFAFAVALVGVAIVVGSQVGDAAVTADVGSCHSMLGSEPPPKLPAGAAADLTREQRRWLFCESLSKHHYLWAGVNLAGALVLFLGIWAWLLGRSSNPSRP